MINIINSSNSSLGGDRYYLFAIIVLAVVISFYLSELPLKIYANYIVAMVIVTAITIMNGHFFIDKPGYLDLSDKYRDAAAQYRKTGVFESPTLPTGWGIGFEKEKK